MPAAPITHATTNAMGGSGNKQTVNRSRGNARPRIKPTRLTQREDGIEKDGLSQRNENGHQSAQNIPDLAHIPNDWKEGLVAPERDVRIQTEVHPYSYL